MLKSAMGMECLSAFNIASADNSKGNLVASTSTLIKTVVLSSDEVSYLRKITLSIANYVLLLEGSIYLKRSGLSRLYLIS